MSGIDAAPRTEKTLGPVELSWMIGISVAMLAATGLRWWPISWTEVFGFITGGICVWLVVKQHIWNWPIGLLNNLVFFVLFWKGRLFADACLQLLFFGLGVFGWWSWLRRGPKGPELPITRATPREWLLIALFVPAASWCCREVLILGEGASPFWDAMTTVLSLAAQALMCRKRLEHWYLWIIADVIYVPLYLSRQLPLTAVLYFVFLIMCVTGWRTWLLRAREVGGVTA